MWTIDTPWFDVAVVGMGFAIGNILFGRFNEHQPRWRRVMKLVVVLAVTLLLARTVGRAWAYGWMLVPAAFAVWVHLVWLPRQGVSGWTAEPRDRYRELIAHARLRDVFRRPT